MNINFYHEVKKAFKNSDDYDNLLLEYSIIMSCLITEESITKLIQFEQLQKEKNITEIMYALVKGFNRAPETNKLNLFENGVDETIDFKQLHSTNSFCELQNKIINAQKELTCYFNNNSEVLEKLFEIYSYVNYEFIKIAYILGYQIQITNRTLQYLTRSKLEN